MADKEWKPWWEKVGDFDTFHEKEEFMKGIGGKKPKKDNSLLNSAAAGFVGGMVAKGSSKNDETSTSAWFNFWGILIGIGLAAYWFWAIFVN